MLNRDNFRFSMVQWCYWSGTGLIFAFLTAYFQFLGFSSIQIGLAMSLVAGASILGQPISAYLADRFGSAVPVLQWSLGLGILFSWMLFFLPSFYLAVILSVLASLVIQTLPPIIDSWTMDTKKILPGLDYGFSRAMGSVGFSITVSVAGNLFDRWSLKLMFPLASVFFLITAIMVTRIRGYSESLVPQGKMEHVAVRTGARGAFGRLLSRSMLSVLIVSFIAFTAFRTVQIFLPILITERGGMNNVLGYSLGVMAFCEVPFMIISSWLLTKFRDTRILLVAFLFFFLRVFVHTIVPGPGWIIAAQALQGPSFGLFLPAFVHLLNRLSPEGSKAAGQAAGTLATFGLGSVAGSALGGALTESFGVVSMFGIMSVVVAGAVILYLLSLRLFLERG